MPTCDVAKFVNHDIEPSGFENRCMPAQNPTDFGPHTRRGLPHEDAAKHHPPEQADDKRGTKFSVEYC